jgi:protein tyrosine/serine phosphatase
MKYNMDNPESDYNFQTVDPGRLYRSAQPSGSFLEYVKDKYGIKTVVDLRSNIEYSERIVAKEKGMLLLHFPVKTGFRKKDREGIRLFLKMFENPESLPVLVHCRKGVDRTGVFVALYRASVQKQDEKLAIKEAEGRKINLYWKIILKLMLKFKIFK